MTVIPQKLTLCDAKEGKRLEGKLMYAASVTHDQAQDLSNRGYASWFKWVDADKHPNPSERSSLPIYNMVAGNVAQIVLTQSADMPFVIATTEDAEKLKGISNLMPAHPIAPKTDSKADTTDKRDPRPKFGKETTEAVEDKAV